MARRVLLISANQCSVPDPVFPIGLAHLNAALHAAGYQTEWFDYLASTSSLRDVLRAFQPDYVGISLRNIDDVLINKQQTFYSPLLQACHEVKATHPCPVILGGSGFSVFPQRLLEMSQADYGIHGEGEKSFPLLLEALAGKTDYTKIPGLVYRPPAGGIRVNPQIPSTSYLRISRDDYPQAIVQWHLDHGGMLNVQTQRGCFHSCTYCTYPIIEGKAARRKSAEMIAEEFKILSQTGARYMFIVDSVFNTSATHVAAVCEALIKTENRLKWGCFLRPQGLTQELMRMMARAGLSHVEFGSDSFCDSVLENYSKKLTFADILESSNLAQKENLDYCHFLICGGPGETEGTLEISWQNSLALKNAVIMAIIGMRIYPGTSLHQRALAEGLVKAEDDLLAPSYYLSPKLSKETVMRKLKEFSARSSQWITGDPTPEYVQLVTRMRQRKIIGPLWSYFAALQRIMPSPLPT
jgi:radical SAM superfamily enzyme YgiQ (UPF0313 family)